MNTKDTVYIALFAAIHAAMAMIPPVALPIIAVPIAVQSLGPMIAGSVLGAKRGALATLLFLALAAMGLPVLTGGRGGFGVFLGPTGGYLLAYPFAAFVIGWLSERFWSRVNVGWAFAFNALGGVVLVNLAGSVWFSQSAGMPLQTVLFGSLVFVPGDLIKAAIAAFVAVIVRTSYPIISASR